MGGNDLNEAARGDPRLVEGFRDLASAHGDRAEYYRGALCFWRYAPALCGAKFLAALRAAAELDGVSFEEGEA